MAEVAAAAWAFLSKLPWKWIGIALAAVGVATLLYKSPWAEARGRAYEVAKYQPVMERSLKSTQHAIVVLAGADTTMNRQSASIRAQASAQNTALAVAYKKIAEADKRDVSRQAQIVRLRDLAAQPIKGAPCDLPDEIKADWK